jgi:ribosomal protein S14
LTDRRQPAYCVFMSCGDYGTIFDKKTRTLNWLRREKIFRIFFIKKNLQKLTLNALRASDTTSYIEKSAMQFSITKLSRIFSASMHVSRCLNSGRTRFVTRKFGLSRMILRNYLRLGKLPQVIKHTR